MFYSLNRTGAKDGLYTSFVAWQLDIHYLGGEIFGQGSDLAFRTVTSRFRNYVFVVSQ